MNFGILENKIFITYTTLTLFYFPNKPQWFNDLTPQKIVLYDWLNFNLLGNDIIINVGKWKFEYAETNKD